MALFKYSCEKGMDVLGVTRVSTFLLLRIPKTVNLSFNDKWDFLGS